MPRSGSRGPLTARSRCARTTRSRRCRPSIGRAGSRRGRTSPIYGARRSLTGEERVPSGLFSCRCFVSLLNMQVTPTSFESRSSQAARGGKRQRAAEPDTLRLLSGGCWPRTPCHRGVVTRVIHARAEGRHGSTAQLVLSMSSSSWAKSSAAAHGSKPCVPSPSDWTRAEHADQRERCDSGNGLAEGVGFEPLPPSGQGHERATPRASRMMP
jgi:hypothetical protein